LSVGNYVYNNFASNTGVLNGIVSVFGVGNGSTEALTTGFESKSLELQQSDYYLRKASFFRLDNISFGYNFGSILKNQARLRMFVTIQNLLVISPYKGVDPEIFNGIDNTIYPRPRIFSLGLNIQL
jgi:iron complex outermembrane receptor protein